MTIFEDSQKQVTSPESEAPATQEAEQQTSTLDALVGEGKKFADVESLAKRS